MPHPPAGRPWAITAWLVAPQLSRLPRLVGVGLLLAGAASLAALTAASPLLTSTFNPYLSGGWPISALVLLLAPFAYRAHVQTTSSALLVIAGMLAGLHIPVGWVIPGQPVLDRPLVETALCLPLAVLGGLGLDGLFHAVRLHRAAVLAGVLCTAAVLLHAAWAYHSRPVCCIIFSESDAIALDWMSAHLPPEARILTAAAEMRVAPQTAAAPLAGSDAGVWIPILTGHRTLPAPYDTDFSASSTHQALCNNAITYIYVGGAGQVFNIAHLLARPHWYVRVFSMPPVSLYQVIGCDS
ncbi:MAG: hypothetical protein WHV44_06870 [Anaerolineales bacterium]